MTSAEAERDPAPARAQRALNLLAALMAAGEPLTATRIANEVAGYTDADAGTAERRIARDIAALRESGVTIERVRGHDTTGYVIPPEGFAATEQEWEPDELLLLSILTRYAPVRMDAALLRNLRLSLTKLEADVPETGEPPAEPAAALSALTLFQEGLVQRRPVRFRYAPAGGRASARVLETYGIGYWNGQWYAVGRDTARGEMRTFRLSRTTAVKLAAEAAAYTVPEDFRLDDHLNLPAWALRKGARTAHVEVAPALRARAAQWFGAGAFAGTGAASNVARIRVSDPVPLFRLLLENVGGLRLVGPKALVKRFGEMVGAMQENWKWPGL